MTPAARLQAAIDIIDAVIHAARTNGPAADAIMSDWGRAHRFAGSKDRRAIREHVWEMIRAFGDPPPSGRAAALGMGRAEWDALFNGEGHGPAPAFQDEAIATPSPLPRWLEAIRPDWLDEREAAALLERAPLDVRVNALKADISEVVAAFPNAKPLPGLTHGLRLAETPDLAAHPLYRDGAIEVQDAGSQWVSVCADPQPGETVIDLCAGAGGKALALAAAMGNQGRIIACDTSRARLSQLLPRAERAGATIIDTRLLDPGRELEALAAHIGKADLVLVDAPCSGSGTWRRSPDLRWRTDMAGIARVTALQARIIDIAQQLVRPGGRLAYAVCSVLDTEGADQMAALQGWQPARLPSIGRARGAGRVLSPAHNGTDGFFIAGLIKAC